MERLKPITIVCAVLLLVLVLLSPVLQVYLRLGVMATRDAIAGWSYGLAQIAFGLVAAFVIFFLPQVIEIGRLRWQWDQTLLYYMETDQFDRDEAFSALGRALEACSNVPSTTHISDRTKSWIVAQKSLPAGSRMTDQEIHNATTLLSRELKELIESREKWTLMVEKAGLAVQKGWQDTKLRRFLFAVHSSDTLRRRHISLSALLCAMIGTSILFGSLALAPDPFWYLWLTRLLTGDVLFRSERNYPEMSLWITACSYLAEILFLTLWFGLETLSVHLHDPDAFDGKTP